MQGSLEKFSQYLAQAIALEVCIHPKPGLVTRCGNGSHTDMSILTFAVSSAIVARAFERFAAIGAQHSGEPKTLLAALREQGRAAEAALLAATKGVNTQRGILFAGGILAAAGGYLSRRRGAKPDDVFQIAAKMAEGIVETELQQLPGSLARTAGEILYQTYGVTGIRGEAEQGFPSVRATGLPALETAFSQGASLNDACVYTLLALLTCVEDSNVIWRTDLQTLHALQQKASAIQACGSVLTSAGRRAIDQLEAFCRHQNISPGGSADLLVITIATYLLRHGQFPGHIL